MRELVQLAEVCTKQSSNIAQKDLEPLSGDFPIYGAAGLIKGVDFYTQENDYIGIVKDGAGVGRAMLLPARSSVIGTMLYLIPNEKINIKYLYYALIKMRLAKYATGATIPHIYFKDFKEERFYLPDFAQQQQVVSIFDAIEGVIQKRKQQLEKLDLLVKAKFYGMFGDLRKNTKRWTFLPLSSVCDVRDGTHDSPKYHESGYPLLTSKNFTNGEIDFTSANFISQADFDAINKRSKVDVGDIVMPMIGTIGHPVIIDTATPFAIKNVALIKFGASKLSNAFVRAILDSNYFVDFINSKNRGNTQKFIALSDIRSVEIPNVPTDLQKEFARFVERTEKIKIKIKQSLEKLELLKQSLLQKYFG